MNLDEATARDYAESQIIALARTTLPYVPEDLLRSIFAHGYAMGSLYGFGEARATFEETLMEFQWNQGADQVKRGMERPEWLRNLLTGGRDVPNGR